jgi:hypothetical protein
MALTANIRSVLSGIAVKFAEGVVEYRRLTSAPNASPRTYGLWTTISGARIHETHNEQVQNTSTGVWYLEQSCELRVPFECGVLLTIRDQIRTTPPAGVDTDEQVWALDKEISCSAGSVTAYRLVRRDPILTDPRKGGGV